MGFSGKEKLLFLAEPAVHEKRSWQQGKKCQPGKESAQGSPSPHALVKHSSIILVSDNSGDGGDLRQPPWSMGQLALYPHFTGGEGGAQRPGPGAHHEERTQMGLGSLSMSLPPHLPLTSPRRCGGTILRKHHAYRSGAHFHRRSVQQK